MLHDKWLDIPCIIILHSFSLNLEWLVTKIAEGIFSQLYLYSYFTRALQQKVKARVPPESSCFRTKAHPWETFESR